MNDLEIKKYKNWIINEKYGGNFCDAAKEDFYRIEKMEPVDYVIGWSEFLRCKIDLEKKPLIPRVETEFWVEKALQNIKSIISENKKKSVSCLDLFCGSGCIGISVLKHISEAKMDFADIEEKYFQGIKKSMTQNKIDPKRCSFWQSDIFSNIKNKYDFIFANPPYVDKNRKKFLDGSVTNWEPYEAIFADKNGMFFIEKFIREALEFLFEGGTIYCEFDSSQVFEIYSLLEKEKSLGKFSYFNLEKDQFGADRLFVINK